MNFLVNLGTAHLQFHYKAKTKIVLPPYKGATFRGTFGHTFKNLVCVNTTKVCQDCPFAKDCAYYYVFETPNNGRLELFSSSPKAPQPYIVEPPLTRQRYFEPGESFTMDLVLVAKAIDYLPYFVYTFEEMGQTRGIGKYSNKGFGRYTLEKVVDLSSEEVIYEDQRLSNLTPKLSNDQTSELPEHLTIEFLSPTRIKQRKMLVEKTKDYPLTFPLLIHSIFRRAYLLHFFHQSEDLPPYQEPEVESLEIVERDFEWLQFEHYSNRSKRRVPNSGFIGSIKYSGDWHSYFPLLQLGEKIHIGKEITFGLGKFAVQKELK